MNKETVVILNRNGMGDGPQELRHILISKLFTLALESGELPNKILFYNEGIKLACNGSPIIDQLKQMEAKGVELVLCQTCLNFFALQDQVQVGVIGGMGDMLEAMQKAPKLLNL